MFDAENGEIAPQSIEEELELDLIDEDEAEESIDDVKARLAKAEEVAENQRIRAEKAEKAAKEGREPKKEASPSLSTLDSIAIIRANVADEDIERVERFAKSEGITIREALANSELKAILTVRAEERETAAATNTGAVRRGATVVSAERLIQDAQSGKLPETDADIERLIAGMSKNK